jgi:hypothetical protein
MLVFCCWLCNWTLLQHVDLVIRTTFKQSLENMLGSDYYVLLLTLQWNFIPKNRFGDQAHTWQNVGEKPGLRFWCSAVDFAIKLYCNASIWWWGPHLTKVRKKMLGLDYYILLLTLQWNVNPKTRFGDQVHIWQNVGQTPSLRFWCSAVDFAIKLYCNASIWWSGLHLTRFRRKCWDPIIMFCC